jgi:phosphoglycolate phosphatase
MTLLEAHLQDKDHFIWDWYVTLLQDIDHAVAVVNLLLREENLPATSLEQYKKQFVFPVVRYYQKLGFNTEPEYFQKLCERFNDHFSIGLPHLTLWPGAKNLLSRIKQMGKTQSLLSATEQTMLQDSVRRFEVDHLFDHVYGVFDKQAASKVARGHTLMSEAGVAPEATVLIGDTDHDLEVGLALGVEVILVEHGHQCPERLRRLHHRVVKAID